MRKLIFEISIALALTLGAALSFSAENAGGPTVSKAYARASATAGAKSASAYLTVSGNGKADRLVAVMSSAAEGAVLHESKAVDGVAIMNHLEGLDIPPDGNVELRPGGLHVMLTGLKAPLKRGEKIVLTLTFETAGQIEVIVPVGSVAQDGPPAE